VREELELLVIGGVPAGLAAASTAHALGIATVLVDEQPLDPSAIRRNVPYWFGPRAAARATRPHDLYAWLSRHPELQSAMEQGVDVRLGWSAWGLFPENIVGLYDGQSQTTLVTARAVILATGATDLHLAFPGWTLGGVLGARGALYLLDSRGYLDAQRLLVLGAGPLARDVVHKAQATSTEVVGLVDIAAGQTIRAARGGADLEEVVLTELGSGTDTTLQVDSVCVAIGEQPAVELGALIDLGLVFDRSAGGFAVAHDVDGRTSRPGVFVAGDAGGVYDVDRRDSNAARDSGARAARAAAAWLRGERSPSFAAAVASGERSPLLEVAGPHSATSAGAYLTEWHRAADALAGDDVFVCRCEEITRAAVLAALGQTVAADPDEVKRISRAGMGICQGRGCRPILAGLVAARTGRAFEDVPLAHYRPPVRPIPMAALATEEIAPNEPPEVIRAANFRIPSPRAIGEPPVVTPRSSDTPVRHAASRETRQSRGPVRAAPATPEADVVVIGAGIVGVASAYYLARRGQRVVVCEKGVVAGEASGRNGGHLAPTIDGAWAPLGKLALDTWPELIPEIDGPTEYSRRGGLYVVVAHDATDPADILAYRHAQGFVAERLSPEECRKLLPGLATDIKGGVLSPRHGQVNPILTAKSLASTAARLGAEFRLRSAVTGILTRGGEVEGVETASGRIAAPVVVNAAGAWAGTLARTAGVDCPIGPHRIQILLSEAIAPISEVIWGGNGLYGRQARAGHLHFGAGGPAWEASVRSFDDRGVGPGGMQRTARRMQQLFPELGEVAILRSWSGIIGPSDDGVPILHLCDVPRGFIIASGFGGNGFVTGPAVGKVVAALACGEPSPVPIDGLSLDRFGVAA
jgi:glycine/D-amino acid oxidase-like deaminating enzyme